MTVIHFATYPTGSPRHGGQVRAAAIQEKLRQSGFDVAHVALMRAGGYPDEPESEWNIPIRPEFCERLHAAGKRIDLHATDYLVENPDIATRLVQLVTAARPEAFILEQPWLWPFVRRIREDLDAWRDVPVVYSSQNVESELMKVAAPQASARQRDGLVAATDALERDLVAHADAVIAVTDSDAAHLRRMGASLVQVCPNGTAPRPGPGEADNWTTQLADKRVALFVGSAHPPNADGYFDMLGPAAGFLPPDQHLVVAGGVGILLERQPLFRKYAHVNAARLTVTGPCPAEVLSTLIELARLIILPITVGSGSNIKTAEALYSRRRILATTKAMHGYEEFRTFPTVTIADEPHEFRSLVVKLLDETPCGNAPLSDVLIRQLDDLLWANSLRAYPIVLAKVINGHARREIATPNCRSGGASAGDGDQR